MTDQITEPDVRAVATAGLSDGGPGLFAGILDTLNAMLAEQKRTNELLERIATQTASRQAADTGAKES